MAAQVILMTKERTGMATVGCVNEAKMTSYARFVCALNLDSISSILKKSWTFSIAMDMSTHMSTSYLDIRARIFVGGSIHNFHVMAIPMFSRHTAEQIFIHAADENSSSKSRGYSLGIHEQGFQVVQGESN
jgi:hypothetical protein